MRRRQRTELLIEGPRELAAQFAAEILNRYEVTMVEEPNHGLVMVKVRETAKKSLFYLGEVMVTECKVRIGETLGIGIVKGHEPELVYALAVIDAAFNADLLETKRWTELLHTEERKLELQRADRMVGVLKTRVSFETMAES